MELAERLEGVKRIFLDTSPVIYFFEGGPFASLLAPLFSNLNAAKLTAVTSPVTLTESLILPLRNGAHDLAARYAQLLVHGTGVEFKQIDDAVAKRAAEIRVRHGLRLMDAYQVAAAIEASCDALLTNDAMFRRVVELPVILLSEHASP